MNDILKQIKEIGIVPVISISDASKAVPLAKALVAGGIPCAEITFRTAQGEESIKRIAAEVPEVLLCAGTVLTIEQAERAIKAGAKFVVSPGFNPNVVGYCVQNKIQIVPGCSNPSDMEAALELGLNVVKFFPAEQAGGLAYIKACAAPYTNLMFMPTGGISLSNLASYISYDRIVACGGSFMVTKELLDSGNYEEITRLCKEAVQIVKDARK